MPATDSAMSVPLPIIDDSCNFSRQADSGMSHNLTGNLRTSLCSFNVQHAMQQYAMTAAVLVETAIRCQHSIFNVQLEHST